jgi:hypothetical protein
MRWKQSRNTMTRKPRRSERDGMWDERLVCHVQQAAYDARIGVGRLDFPAGCCCDMAGAIELFTAIDPHVEVIETLAGGEPDTVYRLNTRDGEWKAFVT